MNKISPIVLLFFCLTLSFFSFADSSSDDGNDQQQNQEMSNRRGGTVVFLCGERQCPQQPERTNSPNQRRGGTVVFLGGDRPRSPQPAPERPNIITNSKKLCTLIRTDQDGDTVRSEELEFNFAWVADWRVFDMAPNYLIGISATVSNRPSLIIEAQSRSRQPVDMDNNSFTDLNGEYTYRVNCR